MVTMSPMGAAAANLGVLCYCLLLGLSVVQGDPAAKSADDPNVARCDSEYMEKYIRAKVVFDVVERAYNPVEAIDENPQQDSDDESESEADSEASSRENCPPSSTAPPAIDARKSFRTKRLKNVIVPHMLSTTQQLAPSAAAASSTIQTKNLTTTVHLKGHNSKPLTISIKTIIGISFNDEAAAIGDDDSAEQLQPAVKLLPQLRRRKREAAADDEWEGEATCRSSRRLIGGSLAKTIEDIPYMVYIETGCGGSVISNSWVITATHCITPTGPKYVYAGSLRLMSGCKYTVERTHVHPNFQEKTVVNDIALLKVRQPFVFSPAIKAIPMTREKPKPGECGVVSGWGATILNGSMIYDMKMARIPVVQSKRCRMFPMAREGQFCAGFRGAQTDTCQGDSGGPFVVDGVLVGIVSYGYRCALPEMPGVYTDVAHYRKWIQNVTGIE